MITLDVFLERDLTVDKLEGKCIDFELLEYLKKYGDDETEIEQIKVGDYATNGLYSIGIDTEDSYYTCYIKQEEYENERG